VDNVDRAASGSARITEAVNQLAESQRIVYVRQALTVAQRLLAEAGGVELGEHRSACTVRNQVTGHARTAELPDLLLGGVPLDRDDDPRRPAPLVDDVVAQVGGSCTLFQRLDDDGAMVRAGTSVLTPAGRRNIGTYIPRTHADGTPNPVLAAVLAGQTYTGAATVAERPYFTAYAGVRSAAGDLIGMLYVGLPLESMG
jgi:methyl-accepting chemotaxis protein